MLHVIRAQHVDEYRVHVWFNDGTDGEIDLAGKLSGPIFAPLRDVDYFQQFRLEGHTLAWENGADFAPEYLFGLVESASKSTAS
ncbi:MAG: DUF2442 domain-containing protein [Planctomycetales bacterium]|nr:DUF2442 domain-containing protein [Planctomycetales bacterium]